MHRPREGDIDSLVRWFDARGPGPNLAVHLDVHQIVCSVDMAEEGAMQRRQPTIPNTIL
jgi:hypothetical protein